MGWNLKEERCVQMEEEELKGASELVTDKQFLLRLLAREDEVAQAQQPGSERREALQCMRQAADVLGSMTQWQPNRSEPSRYGAAEHKKQEDLAKH